MDVVRETLAEMLSTGDFSDLTLSCKGRDFKVHKAVVCKHSPVIKAALKHPFKEAQTGVYEIQDFDAETVWCMVQFMYKGDYQNSLNEHGDTKEESTEGSVVGSDSESVVNIKRVNDTVQIPEYTTPTAAERLASVLVHIHVNSIADYFGLDSLVTLANTKLKDALEEWITADSYTAAQKYAATQREANTTKDGAENECENQADGLNSRSLADCLPQLIKSATVSTGDKHVLDVLASASAINIESLLRNPAFKDLDVVSDFSRMVLQYEEAERKTLSDALRRVAQYHHKEKDDLTRRLNMVGEENARMMEAINTLNGRDGCRNCGAEWMCYITLGERFARCAKCRCKH